MAVAYEALGTTAGTICPRLLRGSATADDLTSNLLIASPVL